MKTRRQIIRALGAAALIAALPSFAQQQARVWRVGFLSSLRRPDTLDAGFYGAFRAGMRELGYVEGKNLAIEWRFADGKWERLPGLAAELVQLKVDTILAAGTQATAAAQKATAAIPIVMGAVGDPVASGFAKSLARPGSNITGLSNLAGDIGSKHLEMLLGVMPKLSHVGVLINPDNSSHAPILENVRAAANRVSVQVTSVKAQTPPQVEDAFATMARDRVGAVIAPGDQFFLQQRTQIAALAVKHRMASILVNREYPEAGGLMSYGHNIDDLYRRAATYVDKIFKGARAADLPIEQPTRLDLSVNQKTAKALGITIPQSILVRADRVIE